MFRTIYFNKEVVKIVKAYADESNITYNMAVNEIIRQWNEWHKEN